MATQKQPDALIHKQAEELSRDARRSRRPVVLGRVNLLLALLALLVLAGAYWMGVLAPFLPEALALVVLNLSLVTAVGDSGNSLAPHLHFHVQDSPDFGEQARTVPVVFRDAVLIRGGRESTPAEADLRRGDHIRRIEG